MSSSNRSSLSGNNRLSINTDGDNPINFDSDDEGVGSKANDGVPRCLSPAIDIPGSSSFSIISSSLRRYTSEGEIDDFALLGSVPSTMNLARHDGISKMLALTARPRHDSDIKVDDEKEAGSDVVQVNSDKPTVGSQFR